MRAAYVTAGVGIAMVALGCYLVYPPAALIVPGVLIFRLALRAPRV